MANLPISLLPQSTTLQGDELLVNVQGGVTKKQSVQQILNANLPVTSSGITLSGDIVPATPQGATLGTIDKPFREIYLQSGSISIESDTPGDPSAIISNIAGNLEISVGGMLLIEPQASFIAPTGSFSYLSSSFNHIGTANRLGDTITTGSLKVSGSTIMFGDNTMTGKTSLTGSVNISGSTNLVGNTTLQNELIVNNHTQFNHGGFDSTVTQTATAGVSGSITFNNTNNLKNVSLVSNSKITVAKGGVYIIQFSAQIDADDGAGTIYIWFKKNGTSIPNSATKVELSNNDASVMTVNILDTANDNDYYELAYQNSNGNLKLKAVPAAGNIPSIPSVIVTITQVG